MGHHVPWMVVGHRRGTPSVPRQWFDGGAIWLVPPLLRFFIAIVAVVVVVVISVVVVVVVVVVAVVVVVRVVTDL